MAGFKNNNGVYWRDLNTGRIVCPGDDCLEECSEDCPIWCNTLAARYFSQNNYKKAEDVLLKAVSKAPDFKDAWNNLGAVYGLQNMHAEAYSAYKRAYDVDNNYKNAVYGIAVSLKNMGNYQECLKWCDLFKQRFNDSSIDGVIDDCSKRMKAESKRSASQNDFNNIEEESKKNNKDLSLEEEYGKLIPLLLNDDTRNEGYSKIEKLFNNGYSEAGIILGQRYAAVDREKARNFYSAPAKENNAEALWGLAGCSPHNYVPQKNNEEDETWVQAVLNSARLGCPDAMNEAGNIENRRNNYYMSAYWYGLAELYEHPQAIYGCKGIAKKWVEAGKPDIPEEFKDDPLYQQAAYMIRTDTDEKVDAFNNIINVALNDGYSTLALFAAKVFEMQKNNEMAAKMYQVAAMEGDLYSIRAMADMLMTGSGCKQDSNKAMQFYEQAAIRGEKVSCFVMGEFERNKGNIELANAWYAKSLVRGYDPAAQRIQTIQNTERNIQNNQDDEYKEDSEMTTAKELFDSAEQLRVANQKKEAKNLYQEAYDLGWAPAKRFLDEILYWEKQKERGKEFNELIKQGKITSVNLGAVPNFKDSASIDADFCDKIEKYVSYLISCNQTNEALTYLYDVLFERLNNSKSKQLIAEVYEGMIDKMDETSYDKALELKLLNRLSGGSSGSVLAKRLKEERFKEAENSDKTAKENPNKNKEPYTGEPDYTKGKELCGIADKCLQNEEYDEARELYQQSYDLGWAPAKNGLHALSPEKIDEYKKVVEMRKKGQRPKFKGEDYPIDEEYAEKIRGYINHLVKYHNTSEINYAFGYLYRLLEDRHDRRSIMYLFEAYKNSLPYIDKTSYYNEDYEVQLLDAFIQHGGGFSTEMESIKNARYRKPLFSNKWTRRK